MRVIRNLLYIPLIITAAASWANSQEDSAAILLERINGLQQEIQQLRGELEVQAHDLKLLNQQQQAFYQDIERRVTNQQQATAQTAAELSTISEVTTQPVIEQQANTNTLSEQARYAAAYQQVRNRKFDAGIISMQEFLIDYPDSLFAVNAYYWLGELYLAKEQPQQAIEQFTIVLAEYPDSTKTAHAMLKLGYAYQAEGALEKAREQLHQVQQDYPGSNTAKLAENRLQSIDHAEIG